MRSINDNPVDPLGNLGKKVPPAPSQQQTSTQTGTPGILRKPDGRLETQIPTPSRPRIYLPRADA